MGRLCLDWRLRLSVCPHLKLRLLSDAIELWNRMVMEGWLMICTMSLNKVKKSCAVRRPHSPVQTPSGSSSNHTKTAGYGIGGSGWPTVSYESHCALFPFHNAILRIALMHGSLTQSFDAHSAEVQTTLLGRHTRKPPRTEVLDPSPGSACLWKRLSGVWLLHVLQVLEVTGESWVSSRDHRSAHCHIGLTKEHDSVFTKVLLWQNTPYTPIKMYIYIYLPRYIWKHIYATNLI